MAFITFVRQYYTVIRTPIEVSVVFIFLFLAMPARGQNALEGEYLDTLFKAKLVLLNRGKFEFYYPPGPDNYSKDTFYVNGTWKIVSDKAILLNSHKKPQVSLNIIEGHSPEVPEDSILLQIYSIRHIDSGVIDTFLDRVSFMESIEINNAGDLYFPDTSRSVVIPKKNLKSLLFHTIFGDYKIYPVKGARTNIIKAYEDLTKSEDEVLLLPRFSYFDNEPVIIAKDCLVLDGRVFLKKAN